MKRNFKKLIAIALSTAAMITVLSGCGSETTSDAPKKSDTSTKQPVTLTYAIWDKNQEPGMKAIADAFTQENPNIKVKVEVTPWNQYWTKLEAAATGGELPDVFWMHVNNFLKYQSNGLLMDITDRLKDSKDVDLNNFPEGLVDLYTADEKKYAIPKDYDTIALWYNKTLFDQANIPYPDDTWDWNKLLEVAQKLTDPSKGIYGFSAPQIDQEGYWNFIYQNGGYVISEDRKKSGYDQEATKEAIQFYADLSLKYKVSPTIQQFADTSSNQYFESGKTAMCLAGSWMISEFGANDYVKQNCDLTVIPHGKEKASIYNGLGNAVSAKTKHPEEAWKFLEFMGTKEANMIQGQKGAAIPAYKGCESAWIDFNKGFNVKAYSDMLEYGVIYQNSKTAPKWSESQKTYMTKILSGQVSVEDGCNQLAKEMNGFLDSEK